MKDLFEREITYMRISVTDLCNLRCRYCMPADGIQKKNRSEIMTEDEIISVIEVASELGINKIRFTGGEPLIKKNIVSICERTCKIPKIKEVCLTTNGILFPEFAVSLKNAGLSRVNISLDTLKPEKYSYITRGGSLNQALNGIEAAINNGFKVKINTVLIKGFNDDELIDLAKITLEKDLDIRFIELMPMLDDFNAKEFITSQKILDILPDLEPLKTDGVAKMYKLKNSKGKIGFISPISEAFCSQCNRIRLTADGYIKPCLHSDTEIYIRNKNKNEIKSLIIQAINAKPQKHNLSLYKHTQSLRTMNRIGG